MKMVKLEKRTYCGVADCLHWSNGTVDLVISTSFGPRILFYGYTGGQNLFKNFSEQLSGSNKKDWQSYGGHRLWHAPEVLSRTYYPDNEAIPYKYSNNTLILDCPEERSNHLKKRIEIRLSETGTEVQLKHYLYNTGPWDLECAAWCLSVMAPKGRVLIPQEEFRPHPECVSPARPLVLWHFTKMNDPRFTWGARYIQMREDSKHPGKQKFGVANTNNWVAYELNQEVFIKQHKYLAGETYPDMGCNAEFYTEAGFLEIESLSPLCKLVPGEHILHEESWQLVRENLTDDEASFDKLLAYIK